MCSLSTDRAILILILKYLLLIPAVWTMWLVWLVSGCSVDVPEYPFDEQYDSFAFNSLLTRQESIQAIGLVGTECNKVAAMSLFHIPTAKHMRLEEFEQTQSQATSHVSTSIIDCDCLVKVLYQSHHCSKPNPPLVLIVTYIKSRH